MEKSIVEEICKKYGEDEKVIKILISISAQEGFLLEKIKEMLHIFYSR